MHNQGASSVGHLLVGTAIAHHLTAAGMSCRPEFRFLREDRQLRPDFLVHDASGGTFLTDHTIINPLSASRRDRPVDVTLEAVAQTKRDKYAASAAAAGMTFVPLVCSAFGRFHPATEEFIRLKTAKASDAYLSRWSGGKRAFLNAFVSAVSCAVQKRNAVIAFTALQEINNRLPHVEPYVVIP